MSNEAERPQSLMSFFDELQNERFYGEIVVKFEAGKVSIVKKTETIKLASE